VLGDIELFALALRRRAGNSSAARPVTVGITGSNGKSTVTTMVSEMGKAAGLDAVAAGNIGLPALDTLPHDEAAGLPDLLVLELSSFQLETTRSLHLRAGSVLNISDDHLDRYDGIAQYTRAKARIFADVEVQVLNRADPASRAMALPGKTLLTFALDEPGDDSEFGLRCASDEYWIAQGRRNLLRVSELPLTGQHNVANAAAALALCHAAGIAQAPALAALRRFHGLPHRVQRVSEIQGVVFFDDSKGTNVGATVAALNGMAQSVVLIAGGDGKGQDFSPLNEAVSRHARAVILIGHDADRIASAVASSGVPCSKAASLEEAVQMSFCAARPGDIVLLSPACASFDMFDDYAHRARVFVDAVGRLQARCNGSSVQ
jgi:UDP-N-acetylmuramoylalanine--D-glutamate ligase